MNWQRVMQKVVSDYKAILADNLVGIYLHGSCAFGCESDGSDVDFIVVVETEPSQPQKESMIQTLLELEDEVSKKGFEMSVVLCTDCHRFKYPTPYCLHYSQLHQVCASDDISAYCRSMKGADYDLAAHFTVIKSVGKVLYGKNIAEVFGNIPWRYYIDSICRDIEDAQEQLMDNPIYYILNLCRVWAACSERKVLSKEQGGIWAMDKLPAEYFQLVRGVLKAYKSGKQLPVDYDKDSLNELAELLMQRINQEV